MRGANGDKIKKKKEKKNEPEVGKLWKFLLQQK